MTSTSEETTRHGRFNYCFWAKLIVAIPALPLAAVCAASLFTNMVMQVVAGGVAIAVLIYLAIKIDRMPCLLKKVVNRQP